MESVTGAPAYLLAQADALRIPLADASVHCVVTSPPYFSLRDYGVPGQIGLEKSPAEYVARIVAVMREVGRVLRDDGTLWLNLGDSYLNGKGMAGGARKFAAGEHSIDAKLPQRRFGLRPTEVPIPGFKQKDLLGIPWRVAFALQDDGWYLRMDNIWHKPNPMPESVRDRPSKAHEYVFLLTKGQSSTRTIKFADINPETVHFGCDFGSQGSDSGTGNLCVQLATAIFHAAQAERDFSLPPFYSEVWKECLEDGHGVPVADLPPVHLLAAHAARFLNSDVTTKEFLCQLHGLWRHLRERYSLLVTCGLPLGALSPAVFVNADGTIAVNDARKVRKVDLVHGSIIDTVHTGCKYFYDIQSSREKGEGYGPSERFRSSRYTGGRAFANNESRSGDTGGGRSTFSCSDRNLRSVWKVSTRSYKGSHFATFPPKLVEPCVKAGTSERGCCPACGAPWVRQVERKRVPTRPGKDSKCLTHSDGCDDSADALGWNRPNVIGNRDPARHVTAVRTLGWHPSCRCDPALEPVPCVVLDPFAGSGTAVAVARNLGRVGLGLDLSRAYLGLASERVEAEWLKAEEARLKAERPHLPRPKKRRKPVIHAFLPGLEP